jgi:hypothetical protein
MTSPRHRARIDHDVKYNRNWLSTKNAGFRVAQFGVIKPKATDQHHGALLFPDGNIVLVNLLSEGQYARVLQLPAVRREENANRMKGTSMSALRKLKTLRPILRFTA